MSATRRFLKQLPGFRAANEVRNTARETMAEFAARRTYRYRLAYPSGHFHSPIPALRDVRWPNEIADVPRSLPGIDLHENDQLQLARVLSGFYSEMPFRASRVPGLRFRLDNPYFNFGDAVVYYGMLRHLRPTRVVEVGCGFSSALALDVNDRFFGGSMQCTFIEPSAERLYSLLQDKDHGRSRVIEKEVQDEEALDAVLSLGDGDVLFIDSSHVAKVGSDVNRLFFDVLPRLPGGVYVHLHDIHYPFEYPLEWILAGRAWNENYLLRAFLTMNTDYEIVLFNSYLGTFHAEEVGNAMPMWRKNPGGSIWLRRARA